MLSNTCHELFSLIKHSNTYDDGIIFCVIIINDRKSTYVARIYHKLVGDCLSLDNDWAIVIR